MAVTYRDRAYLAHNEVLPQFRWSAIIAGLIAAIATQFLLTAVGTALGVSAGSVAENEDAAKGLGIGAGIWMIISPLVSMFVGGFVATWMARPVDRKLAGFHGAMVWCLSMAIGALMVGLLATGAFAGLLTSATNTAGVTAASVVSKDKSERDQLQSEIKQKKNEAQAKIDKNDKKELKEAAKTAADVGTGAAWASVLAMLLSLGSAVLGSLTAHRAVYAEDTVAVRNDDSRIVVKDDDDVIRPDLH